MSNISFFAQDMYVGVAGNIGAGKSTLARLISSNFNLPLGEESVSDNPFLEDFYGNMKRWSFHTQMYFVVDRVKKLATLLEENDKLVLDRLFYEDKHIFAKHMYHLGNLSTEEYQLYSDFFDIVTKELPAPHLLIYLRAGVDHLKNNIAKRGRDMEKELLEPSNHYLRDLNTLYESFTASYRESPILTIQAEKYDFENNKKHQRAVLELVENALIGE